jgi:hypothetical protein
MNETLDSIKNYNNHFKSFKIPDDLIEYMNNFGKNVIQPSYKGLESLINRETKLLTLEHLEKNSDNYEKSFNEEEFIQSTNNIYSSIKNDIKEINININETHGMNQYPNKLKEEIDKIEDRNLRILNGEDIEVNSIIEQSTEKSLQKILNISENVNRFVKSFENFEQFNEIIQNNINKLNISNKQSKYIIDESFKEEQELYEVMQNKLGNLYNLSLNYYQNIAENYSSLRSYIEELLDDINNLLIQCVNITYETFEKEFENMSSKYKDFIINENEQENKEPISKISISQNTQFTTEANFDNIEKKVKYKFEFSSEGEGQIKNQKIFLSVINQIKPKKTSFKITNKFQDNCGEEYQTVDVEFNNITYTTNLIFDTESNLVNLTSLSNFDSFNYKVARYKINPSQLNLCFGSLGIDLCIDDNEEQCEDKETVSTPVLKTYKKVNKTVSKLIEF